VIETVLFFILATIAVVGALGVVLARQSDHSALFLLLNFIALAAIYVTLNAPFLAAVQIIVYAGAIVVMFLFVVMLLNVAHRERPETKPAQRYAALLLGALLLAGLIYVAASHPQLPPELMRSNNVADIGEALFTEYLLPFELAGLLLLAGVVGAVVLGKRKLEE
jgi:NADH-quinone oxidoreductase subunit J